MQTRKQRPDGETTYHREAALDYRKANVEARTVPATLSSETVVKRWFGNETLRHESGAVDLTRAADGLPLLFNHDSDKFIGAVRNVRVENGKLRGDLQFSENERAQEVFRDVTAGLLRNMSIGYRVEDYTEDASGNVEVTRWTLYEASIAPVPADNSVGVNRNENQGAAVMQQRESETVIETREAEVQRIAEIHAVFATRWAEPKHIALREKMITEGATVDEARAELLDMIGLESATVGAAAPKEQRAADPHDMGTRMTEALAVRMGIETDKEIIQRTTKYNEFTGHSIVEMARAWLHAQGAQSGGNANAIIGRALTTRATQNTTDFPDILANVAFKSLLKAYWDAPETWRMWASVSSLQDFKLNNRVNLSEFDTLPVVAEGGTYTEGSFTDLKETIQLATYGMNYTITREALINDDVSAFTRIPTAMGLAAARTIGDLVYGVLTTNAAMGDTFTLFDAVNHKNDVAVGAGGAPPNADTVQAAKVAMALQQGPKGAATLGIRPEYLMCPVGLEGIANTLMAAQYNPASTAGTLEPNVVQGLLTVVSDHRLDTNDPDMWYVGAGPNAWDTVDVGFLNGNQTPYQERRQDDIGNDNITYKVRIDAAAAPMDWRGLYRNAGKAA
jgi:HK97 family phage prohead protease